MSVIKFEYKNLLNDFKKFNELIEECEKEEFYTLKDSLMNLKEVNELISEFAGSYDFSEETQGNGYWCFILVSLKSLDFLKEVLKESRGRRFLRNLETSSLSIDHLLHIGELLLKMHENSENSNLFFDNSLSQILHINNQGYENLQIFYDSPICFYFKKEMRMIMKVIVASMCAHYDCYKESCRLSWIWKLPKYFLNSQLRAEKVREISHNCDIKFINSWWDLIDSKLLQSLTRIAGPSVAVNYVFKIDPVPLKMSENLEISPIDKPLQCRLVSGKYRRGMTNGCCKKSHNPSKSLIIHLHGGGFVANSSKSELNYLREWTKNLNIPILSIDYSLALDAPFPRAVDEVFYAYCWTLINHERLGTTAENIILCGDSAGSNLAAVCIIKCIEMGIKLPKGFLSVYGIFYLDIPPYPSGFLTSMDPLILSTFCTTILSTYCDEESKASPYVSPYLASDEILRKFPPTCLITAINDPFCDNAVEFGKKLKKLNVKIDVEVVGALGHGFLHFIQVSNDCKEVSNLCCKKILALLNN